MRTLENLVKVPKWGSATSTAVRRIDYFMPGARCATSGGGARGEPIWTYVCAAREAAAAMSLPRA